MGKEKHDVKEQMTVFAYQESIIDLVASLCVDEVSYFLRGRGTRTRSNSIRTSVR